MLYSLKNEFIRRQGEISAVYERAFSGPPYFASYQEGDVHKIVTDHILKPGFVSFLEYNDQGDVIGALWGDSPSLRELSLEWGDSLADFAYNALIARGLRITISKRENIVWEREIFVDPLYHRQGIGIRLRSRFHQYLEKNFPQGALLLTRMRDDNRPILTLSRRMGYQRTLIKTVSRKAEVFNDYWFKVFLKENKAFF